MIEQQTRINYTKFNASSEIFYYFQTMQKERSVAPYRFNVIFSQTRRKTQMIKVKKSNFSPNKRTVRTMHIIRKALLVFSSTEI